MKRLLLAVVALQCGAGCILRETRYVPVPVLVKNKKGEVQGPRECHPSQYWDGDECRHKGKGKGARKHDDD